MLAGDYIFLVASLFIGMLCLLAAQLSWGYARRNRDKPARRRHALLGTALMVGLAIMEFVAGFVEAVLRRGEAVRTLDWFWLGADFLIPCFFLLLLRIMRQRDELENRLIAAAEHDPLTGLPNRAGFAAMAQAALEACRKARQPAVVALLDIDHFKAINDGWGHAAGDDVLRGVARAARPALRSPDVLARIGGEEFAMVLRGVDAEAALPLVERLREAIRLNVAHPGAPAQRVTISAGISPIEGDGLAAIEAAAGRADVALYAAKAAGRDRAVINDPALVA